MKRECINIWQETKEHISETIADINESQVKLKSDMLKYGNKITKLREEIPYADTEEKIYIREELGKIRDRYNELLRETNEIDTELYIRSPYFCKVNTEDDHFYISKYKKDFNNDIFLFTDPIASLGFMM